MPRYTTKTLADRHLISVRVIRQLRDVVERHGGRTTAPLTGKESLLPLDEQPLAAAFVRYVLAVQDPCARCNARVGEPCQNVARYYRAPVLRPHQERVVRVP